MKKKRIVGILAVVVCIIGIASCGHTKPTDTSNTQTDQATENVKKEVLDSEEQQEQQKEMDQQENSTVEENTVTPEFKEAMDSYEAFFNEYVEFMKQYSASDDTASMLTDYMEYMSKYAEVMEKISAIDENQLSTADCAYYLEVNARIQQKLLEIQ